MDDDLGNWLMALEGPAESVAMRLVRRLDHELLEGQFGDISQAFAVLDILKPATLVLVGCLRYTFCARQHIAGWEGFASSVAAEIGRRGEDPAALLRGLLTVSS